MYFFSKMPQSMFQTKRIIHFCCFESDKLNFDARFWRRRDF